jgi:hypothetical protein
VRKPADGAFRHTFKGIVETPGFPGREDGGASVAPALEGSLDMIKLFPLGKNRNINAVSAIP